jgi:hypothetical protein
LSQRKISELSSALGLAKKPPPFPRRCAGKQRVTRHSGAFAAGQVSPSWVKAILYLISQLESFENQIAFQAIPSKLLYRFLDLVASAAPRHRQFR